MWKLSKYFVWVVGSATLLVSYFKVSFGDLANWIQYISGFGMVYGLGLFLEHVFPHLKNIKHLPDIHKKITELHQLHIGGKEDDREKRSK